MISDPDGDVAVRAPGEAPTRLSVTVAHPDDESFGCGSLLRLAADRGMTTAVLCATRGEAGERTAATPPGPARRRS